MKGLGSSLTEKQRVPTIERALMSFWMMLGWISFCFSQHTSCYAVVKRTAYLKGLLALKDQVLLSRSRVQWQSHFCNTTLPSSHLHDWSARKKSWSQSQMCAGSLVFTSVPDRAIEVPCSVPWGPRYSDAPQGIAMESSNSRKHGLGPTVACSLIHTPGNHYKPWAMFLAWQPSALFYCSTE